MRVLTLNNIDFNNHCHKLQALASSYCPDLIVSIASGGDFVAQNIFDNVTHISVECRRLSTDGKQNSSLIRKITKLLPRCVNNVLRIVEAKMLAMRKPVVRDIALTDAQQSAVAEAERVLVVDDAVDSGATLLAVVNAIKKVDARKDVRAAVITVTTRNPLIVPDFSIYNNQTLIRFPWSIDANS